MNNSNLPLVYSCSGCSSAAQMANHLAVQLDRTGLAEMSCIAGVGGNHAITPDLHFELTRLGVPKQQHENFNMDQATEILALIKEKTASTLP